MISFRTIWSAWVYSQLGALFCSRLSFHDSGDIMLADRSESILDILVAALPQKLFAVASFALLIYDYLLTIDKEVRENLQTGFHCNAMLNLRRSGSFGGENGPQLEFCSSLYVMKDSFREQHSL